MPRSDCGALEVRRLQIAVDDAVFVRVLQGVGNLPGDRQRFVERDRPLCDPVRQCRTFDEFHDERLALRKPVDRRDVRMIERGEHLCFTLEARKPLGICSVEIRQHLQRHVAMQAAVVRPIHLAHASYADQGDDFIRAESRTDVECHVG